MAEDKKISQLTSSSALAGTEEIPVVQSSTTKKATVDNVKDYIVPLAKKDTQKYLVPTAKTAEDGVDVDLGDSAYADTVIMKLSWTGGSGTAVYTLPDATATNNTNRFIRFISDDSFASNTSVELTPASGQKLDNSASAYTINKAYEGIAIWSDGTEWYVVQKKA